MVNFIQVDIKKDLKQLDVLAKQHLQEHQAVFLSKEIISYLELFLTQESYKNEIELDNFKYYLIQNEENIGFVKLKFEENFLRVKNFFIKKDFIKKTKDSFLTFLKKQAKDRSLNKIVIQINKKDKTNEAFLKDLGFKKTETQAKYLGSDIFLFENVFELDF